MAESNAQRIARKDAERRALHDESVSRIAQEKGIDRAAAEKELASRDSTYRANQQQHKDQTKALEDLGRDKGIKGLAQKAYDLTTRQGWRDEGSDISNSAKTVGRDASVASKKAQEWLGNAFNNAKKSGLGPENYTAPTIDTAGFSGGGGTLGSPVQIGPARGSLVSNPNDFRKYQISLAQQLADQASGRGPSVAQMQFNEAQQKNQAALFSQLASSHGNALAGRTAAMQNQQLQSQTARDSAIARLAEQQKAQDLLGNVSNQGRLTDTQGLQIAQNRAIEQARLGQQYNELQQKYAQMGLSAQQSNQLAAIEAEKIRRGIRSDNNTLQGDKLSAAGGFLKNLVPLGATAVGGPVAGVAAQGAISAYDQRQQGQDTQTQAQQNDRGDQAAMKDWFSSNPSGAVDDPYLKKPRPY